MIIEEMADLMTRLNEKQSASEISRHFDRERKWVYAIKCGCGFIVDAAFIAGLKKYGYELRLVKKEGETE